MGDVKPVLWGHHFPHIPAHNPTMESLYRYPRGSAGFARLLLRSTLGLLVLAAWRSEIFTVTSGVVSVLRLVVCVALILGFFTSYLGVAVSILGVGAMTFRHMDITNVNVATLILGLAIAVLGPGGLSVDALLFGRRRVIL